MIVGGMEIRLRADFARLQNNMTQARRVVAETQDKINAAAITLKKGQAGIVIGACSPVTCHPCCASQMASSPRAQPGSSAHAGARLYAKRCSTAEGAALVGLLTAAYFASQNCIIVKSCNI